MDYRAIIDQLLEAGRELAQKSQTAAEQRLDIPQQGPEREASVQGLGKGAALGGILALLLGTSAGRKITGPALKLGSLAALGGLAYQAYQNWQAQQGPGAAEPGAPIDRLSGPAAEQRSRGLLKAMIAAAKADGHIDDNERARIDEHVQKLGIDSALAAFLKEELAKPLDPQDVAAAADSPAAAAEIYLTSLLVIDEQNAEEAAYLRRLAEALKLAPDLVEQISRQAKA
ncbi:tellurite resistance TerB family protein [Candidatus Methylocalor cossyra]|uniref:Inner membrane protein YebE n=1 Tax=Candidatus Methylocalor cossyra TaxID=3108543 RepID=A0ABM9NEJ0_9GAMM